MKKNLFILGLLFVMSCAKNPEQYVQHINGYWEIAHVERNNKILKEFTLSSTIDYFEVNEDLTGFRKKVSPTLEGKYIVTQHSSPFTLKIENKELHIYYNVNNVTFKETIKKATTTELVITNTEGFTYTYKPFSPFDLNDEQTP